MTGASTGIGRAIALELAREGAGVVMVARGAERLREAAEAVRRESGGEAVAVPADTSNDASVARLVEEAVRQFGRIDVLVNNAAVAGGRAFPREASAVSLDGVAEDFAEKVLGYLRCAQAVIPYMRANGFGRIINIGGTAARTTGAVSSSIRQVSVSAVSKNLADELGTSGVTVTTIHPGATRTESLEEKFAASESGNLLEQLRAGSSISRLIEPQEVAWIIAFIASPKSAAVNGETITCGGGMRGVIYY